VATVDVKYIQYDPYANRMALKYQRTAFAGLQEKSDKHTVK
jgi:hypothetical protein